MYDAGRSQHIALSVAAGLARSQLAAQEPAAGRTLTLQEAIAIAQQQSLAARSVRGGHEAARWRDKAFRGRLLPQISLEGQVPNFNSTIIPVTTPEGTTVFVPQRQTQSSLNVALTQPVPFTGGEV